MARVVWKSKILILVLIGSFGQASDGQSTAPSCELNHAFSPEEMRADLAEWRTILEANHPALYRFTPRAMMTAEFDRISNSLDHPMNQLAFLKAVSPILGFIKDGHAALNPTGNCRRFIHQQAKQFPLQLRFISGRAYIARSVSSAAPPGTEIIAINGQPLPQIQETIQSRLPRDGNIETLREAKLSAFFPYFYYLYVSQPDAFSVTVRRKGRQFDVHLDALTESDTRSRSYGLADDSGDPPLAYRELGSGVALMRISTFAASDMEDAKQDFPKFLKESFASIRDHRTHDLIIDLRGNSGGDNYGPLLFSYLHDGPFSFFNDFEATTSDLSTLTPWRDQPVGDTWTEFVAKFRSSMSKSSDGHFQANKNAYSDLTLQESQPETYKGQVWFLIDGGTFSATGWFCSIARSYHRGTFVGEESGGDYYGNTGVDGIGFPLRNTRLPFTLLLLRVKLAVQNGPPQDRGVIPDLRYHPTVDPRPGRDRELDFVLRAISKTAMK